MTVILLQQVTKDYGFGRGIFDVSLTVEQGVVYGFLGPNGAGKTTAIRHIMGFSKPQTGIVQVNGKDSWRDAHTIQQTLGYLPGEVALPEHLTGNQFIQMVMELRHMQDTSYVEDLKSFFQLQTSGKIKRMSLGMKRKLAIVTAFMHDPDVLVLDEPTSGLDPIMQQRFIAFILEQKKRGKTILLSSHMFAEVDATCDEISIIKDGKIMTSFHKQALLALTNKVFQVTFQQADAYSKAIAALQAQTDITIQVADAAQKQLQMSCAPALVPTCLRTISEAGPITALQEIPFSLEKHFMNYYDRRTEDAT